MRKGRRAKDLILARSAFEREGDGSEVAKHAF
jgi:hypothetical protein